MLMVNRVPLDNVDHQALRVVARQSAAHGAAVNQLLVVPPEFDEVQREYPILFRKDKEGAFHAVAILGFDREENLFLDEDGWQGRYLPAVLRRGPFFLGVREQEGQAEPRRELTIFVDLDDPRVGEAEGEPLFLRHGGNAPYLEQVADALRTVHHGLESSRAMFAAFAELDLLQPLAIEVRLGDGLEYQLGDFHTVGAEAFAALDGAALERLHRAGHLAAALFARASLANLNRLVELKNRKRGAA
jgi:hypothetical protein